MSLTSEIGSSYSPLGSLLREALDAREVAREVRDRLRDVPCQAEPGLHPQDLSLIGTAIDYRIRMSLRVQPVHELLAWKGAMSGRGSEATKALGAEFFESLISFFSYSSSLIRRLSPAKRTLSAAAEEELARCCVVMASLDLFARSPSRAFDLACSSPEFIPGKLLFAKAAPSERFKAVLRGIRKPVVNDMVKLISIFNRTHERWRRSKHICLNPTFMHSEAVGGADGDLIIGRTYYDIKATQHNPRTSDFMQILSYPLLHHTQAKIDSTGFYLARHGISIHWDVATLYFRMASDSWKRRHGKRHPQKFIAAFYSAVESMRKMRAGIYASI